MRDCKNAGRIAAAVFAATMPMLAGATGGQDEAPVPARQRDLVHLLLTTLAVESPSGIFFTARAARIGF